LNEIKTLNSTLKAKLSDAQESLKSNGEYIAYLNKQLNEKPGGAGVSLGATGPLMSTTASSSFGGKLTKPPMASGAQGAISGTSFKPTFSSIEQLNPGSSGVGLNQGASTRLQRSSSR